MKKVNVYGVEMTSIQEMMFAKFREQKGVSMNTLNSSQRTQLAEEFLNGIGASTSP